MRNSLLFPPTEIASREPVTTTPPPNTQRLTPHDADQWAEEYLHHIPACPRHFTGRGIVICAGGVRYLTNAWVTIRLLRKLGCQLPIQVWYRGPSEQDPQWASLAATWNVECVDAQSIPDALTPRGGWELKSFAILHSPFAETLLLDADNAPVLDPTYLFDADEYRQTGAVFWPDLLETKPNSLRWKIFGVPYRPEPEQESGQILIDKRRCWRELNLCNGYNERSDFFYRYIHGDKDTFRFAWRRVGTPFTMPTQEIERIPHTLCQHDFQGRRLFQHRVHDKWSLAGNRQIPGFAHEADCFSFVEELREQWRPIEQLARRASSSDWRRMREMAETPYEYIQLGATRRRVQLSPDGQVVGGWSPSLFFWWLEGDSLVIAGAGGKTTAILSQTADDVWSGATAKDAKTHIQMVSIPIPTSE